MMTTPGRGRRSISENVWLLQNALAKVLNDGDRTFLIHSLNQYQRDRDILQLVASLKRVLDTPNKREVYPLLREIIPSSDKRYFERAWHTNQPQHLYPSGNNSNSTRSRSRSPNQPQERLRRSQLYSSLPENLDRCDSGVDLPALKKSSSSRSFQKYPIRRLYLKRVPGTGYGFCMRGGSEHGVGLYVSSVDENSIAEYEGLLPGDHILSVNDIQFNGLSHDQAVKIIKKTKKLNMVVRSVGRIPNTFVAESTYKWIDPTGQRVSPPPNVDSNGREMSIDGIHRSDLRLLGDDDERKVNVFIEDGDKLGLKIRGGSEYGLGIYIAGVDPHSAAEKAGLKCGDQIMDVNGISFLNITHADAVKVLKSAKNMMVTMKDVGRLPFAKTVTDKTRWAKGKLPYKPVQSDAESIFTTTVQIHEPPDYRRNTTAGNSRFETERSENSKFRHGIAGSQLLYNGTGPSTKSLAEEQARQVLNENELGTMSYYMDEYCKGFITVDAFVLALFSLFNTPAKVSLLSEVRGFIYPRDIDRFDDLVLKKEIEAIKKRSVTSRVTQDDVHSIRSYSSSVSSFSEHGSTSSKSSAKESLDSRPITPPRVPEILPENMKVTRVGNDLGKSASKELHDDTGIEGLPSFMPNDDTLNDSRDSIPSPPTDFSTVFPLSSSSPRKPTHDAVTNGEITKYLVTGDNTRAKDVPHKKHGSKKNHKHAEKTEKVAEKKPEVPTSEKEHSKPKNDSQSSSDHSFELIPESKKEKRGFFLHLNKGSYSPYKHDHSLVPKESSNLYVTLVKKKDEEYADSPSKRSIGESGEKLENHVETSSKLLKSSENLDSTLVVDSEGNASASKLMNGYYTSPKKHPHESSLANIPNAPAPNAAGKQSSTSKALFRSKPHHAKTEVQNKEESNLEGNQNFKSSAQLNSAFASPKPKPHVSQAQDSVTKDKNDGDHRKEDTRHEGETSFAPQNPKPYVPLQKSEASKEELPSQDSVEHQENEYVDIDSIRRSKQRSSQSKQVSDKNINGDKTEHEYVDPRIIDLGVNPPPKPAPYSSKAENDMAEKNGFSTLYDENPEDNNETNFESRRLVKSPVSNLSPKLKSHTPKTENSIPEKDGSNRHYNGHPEIGETYLESKTNSSSPKSAPYSSIAVDTNSNLSDNSTVRNGRKSGSVVPPNARVYDLKSSAHMNGMFLAMEEITNTRSGLEKSTSWGEESLPTVSSYDSFSKTTMVRETTAKSLQERNSMKNRNYEMIDNDVAVSNHADKEVLVEDRESVTRSDQENVTRTESTTWSHASPKQEKDGATDSPSDSKQEDVKKSERFTKSHALDQKDMAFQYDVNQNLEEIPQKQSVFNMIKAYNRMSDATNTRGDLSRKGSNRKSWDGVENPSKTGQDQEISMVDKKNSLKSNSDSNLMNLPKYQKKSIQVKLRASQELLELRQQSRDSSTNNSRRSSIEVSFPSEQRLSTASSSAMKSQPHPSDGYDVELEKTSNGLGLTLEGGSDTSSRNAPVKIKLVKQNSGLMWKPMFAASFLETEK